MESTSALSLGLGVTSHNDGVVCIANFDNVTINRGTGGGGGGGGTNGVPAAPTGLTATPISSTSIRLAWTDNSTNETGFALARSTDGTTYQSLPFLLTDSISYVDTGLSPSTHYWYKVWASNTNGVSPPSNVAEATTGSGSSTTDWHDQDIGNVSAAGTFSQSGNSYTAVS